MSEICSCGLVFLYLAVSKQDGIVVVVDSYEHMLDFYETVKCCQQGIGSEIDLDVFCVLGIPERVEEIADEVKVRMSENDNRILYQERDENKWKQFDFLSGQWERLILEHKLLSKCSHFFRKRYIRRGAWDICCFWMGKEKDEDLIVEDAVDIWTTVERPVVFGKQMMLQSYLLKGVLGRKVIGAFPNDENGEWNLVFEGERKLQLNDELPYVGEHIGIHDGMGYTVSDIEACLLNPRYAYGIYYCPFVIYTEWHKVFLFVAALKNLEWKLDELVKQYEKFLRFLECYVCDTIIDEPIYLEKEIYWQSMNLDVLKVKSFFKGEEEELISKDLLLLLNSRYVYLPYIYNLLDYHPEEKISNEDSFNLSEMKELIRKSECNDSYQKGIQWEKAAEYFMSHVSGFLITGRRVKTGLQEIDISIVNVSLDAELWKMGAYILVECKNWSKKVGIQTIRGLAHISELKGNKTTILFSAKGITKDANDEVLRIAEQEKYILCITKEEMLGVKSSEECLELILKKWNSLGGSGGKDGK